MQDIEARSWLASVFDVCEYEMQALEALRDARLSGVMQAMTTLRAEIVAALAALTKQRRRVKPAVVTCSDPPPCHRRH